MAKYFVTGTDTNVGKTLVTCALLQKAGQQGLKTLGLKPIAAGCEQTSEGLRNDDALAIQQASNINLDYEEINPVALAEPVSPHIAAAWAGKRPNVSRLVGYCRGAFMAKPEFVLVEGAGGWLVPINERETLADFAAQLELPVILVVGMRLGCINHALLTVQAIKQSGLRLAGWVANRLEQDMLAYAENLQTLQQRIDAPLLGEIPFLAEASSEAALQYLSLESLL